MTRSRDPEQKIALIKKAAAEIITEEGPSALTHRAVAARAGVAVGTTTKYFATINDMRKAGLERLSEEVEADLEQLRQELEDCDDPIPTLAKKVALSLADSTAVVRECSLLFAGVFDEDIRDISLVWTEGINTLMKPHFTPEQIAAMAQYVDGLCVSVALTGKAPSAQQVECVLRALEQMKEEK